MGFRLEVALRNLALGDLPQPKDEVFDVSLVGSGHASPIAAVGVTGLLGLGDNTRRRTAQPTSKVRFAPAASRSTNGAGGSGSSGKPVCAAMRAFQCDVSSGCLRTGEGYQPKSERFGGAPVCSRHHMAVDVERRRGPRVGETGGDNGHRLPVCHTCRWP